MTFTSATLIRHISLIFSIFYDVARGCLPLYLVPSWDETVEGVMVGRNLPAPCRQLFAIRGERLGGKGPLDAHPSDPGVGRCKIRGYGS